MADEQADYSGQAFFSEINTKISKYKGVLK